MLKRVVINTSSSLFTLAVNICVTFIMAPIYVRMLGLYDYGLREMIVAVVGYMGMFELGMRPTISRFTSMYNAKNDKESMLAVYVTSMFFMFLVGMCLALLFFLWAIYYPGSITPEGGESDKYMIFLMIISVFLLFLFPQIVTESHLEGMQRYYIKNNINIISTITIAVVSYIYITPENGLILLTSLVTIAVALKFSIYSFVLSRSAFGGFYLASAYFSKSKLKEMLNFGLKSFVQGTASKIESVSDKLVIGAILGPAIVPVYSIPSSLVGYLSAITQTITHAFMPLFSDLDARGQQDKIKRIYLFASKLVVGLLIPAGIGAMVIGGPFIEVWMRGEFSRDQVDGIIILLTLYTVIPYLNPFASRYLTALGKHGIFAKVAPVAAIANLVLSIWLVFEYGVIGAAIGSVIPVFFVLPIILSYSCKQLGLSMVEYIKQSILPVLSPAIVMFMVILWLRHDWGLNRYSEIVACILVGATIYSFVFWFLSVKPAEKIFLKDWVLSKFSQMRSG